jgi:nitronate monooxygenase
MPVETRLTTLLGLRHPIVQSPMAGGFVTTDLVVAVSEAGALGMIAGAMLSADALREEIAEVRARTDRPFGVNLFAPLEPPPAVGPERIAELNLLLAPFRDGAGLPVPETPPAPPPSLVEAQLAVVTEERVPVFSFTFGIPQIEAIKGTGAICMGTATTVAEAARLEAGGVDVVVVQAGEAGGHRGTFAGPFEQSLVGAIALIPQVVDRVQVPVVAAGGIMDGRGLAAALALGADGAQLGTAFLGCPEAGTPEAYRRALVESTDESTTVTPVYTGRPARTIRTPLIDALERSGIEPLPFPLQGALLADLRAAGVEQGRAELMFLLAGQGSPKLRDLSAGELVEALARETEEAIARLSR